MTPPVTVVMPVYNGAAFLGDAIGSVLAQTFADFELLVVDDASSDESADVIASYRDPRIRFERNARNLGQTATLNRALELARGRYVARLDQDDVSLPLRLERQVELLDRRPEVDVVGTWGFLIDAGGRRVGAMRRRVRDRGNFLGALAVGECPFWHPSVVFRRDAIRALGGYDPSFAPADDVDLWTRLALRGGQGVVLPEVHCLYRLHRRQQSTTAADRQRRSIARSHDRFLAEFCAPELAARVGSLLRFEEGFWRACPTRHERAEVVAEAGRILGRITERYALSPAERRNLRATVTRRVGFGLSLGAGLARGPAVLAYTLFFALSPMLMPNARRLAPLLRRVRALPYRRLGRASVVPGAGKDAM